MAQMKQCPQCGKYVAADRTYCMNCGVTLGIRCPQCRTVMPVGAKTCTACGHSFVKKKKAFSFPLWEHMKRNAKPLILGLVVLCLLMTLVLAAFPGLELTVLVKETPLIQETTTGYGLMGYLLGGHPAGVAALLLMTEYKTSVPLLKTLLSLSGLGWLTLLVGLLFSLLLLISNYRSFGSLTARRLYLPLGVSLLGIGLTFGMTFPLSALLLKGMSKYIVMADQGYHVSSSTHTPLVLLILLGVTLAIHGMLHLAVLSKEKTEGERSIRELLVIPLGGLLRQLLRLVRHIRRKAGQKVSDHEEPAFTVTPRFSSYLMLLVGSLVFTQALLSKVSHIFFWFMFLLPLVLLVYTLIARASLSVSLLCESTTTEKNTPYTYRFCLENRSILALPFVEAQVSIPQSNAVRCSERTIRVAMAPKTTYQLKNTVSFRFRGTYDIGVKCFYVHDFFRLFRARLDVEELTTVYVLPRRLSLEDTAAHSISDDTARTLRSPLMVDRLEVSDIRDYRNGDSLKSIHWKLSSKAENFIVKDYNTGTSNQTVIFCDLAPHFPDEPPKKKEGSPPGEEKLSSKERKARRRERKKDPRPDTDRRRRNKRIRETAETVALTDEALQARLDQRSAVVEALEGRDKVNAPATPTAPLRSEGSEDVLNVHELADPLFYEDMNEYLADGVVEVTIASVLSELRKGHEVLLLWFDRRSDTGVFGYPLRGVDEFENIYHLFATAPLCAPDKKVTALTAMISDTQSAKQMFVVSTMDPPMVTDLCGLPGVSDAGSFGSAEVMLYDPEERFRYPRERSLYLQGCREQLAANGLSLTAGSFQVNRPEGGTPHEA